MMDRPKILPPTLRPKKRYIAFEIISDDEIDYKYVLSALWKSMINLFGEHGAAQSHVWVIKNLYGGNRGLIRCRHDMTEEVRSALTFIKILGDHKAIIKVLGITGTIKTAKIKYLGMKTLKDFTETS